MNAPRRATHTSASIRMSPSAHGRGSPGVSHSRASAGRVAPRRTKHVTASHQLAIMLKRARQEWAKDALYEGAVSATPKDPHRKWFQLNGSPKLPLVVIQGETADDPSATPSIASNPSVSHLLTTRQLTGPARRIAAALEAMARQTDASIRAVAFNQAESAARRRSSVGSIDSMTNDDVPHLTKFVRPRRRSSQASVASNDDSVASTSMHELVALLNSQVKPDQAQPTSPSPVVTFPVPTPPVIIQSQHSFVRRALPQPPVCRENLPITSPRAPRTHTPGILANAPSITPVYSPRSPVSRNEPASPPTSQSEALDGCFPRRFQAHRPASAQGKRNSRSSLRSGRRTVLGRKPPPLLPIRDLDPETTLPLTVPSPFVTADEGEVGDPTDTTHVNFVRHSFLAASAVPEPLPSSLHSSMRSLIPVLDAGVWDKSSASMLSPSRTGSYTGNMRPMTSPTAERHISPRHRTPRYPLSPNRAMGNSSPSRDARRLHSPVTTVCPVVTVNPDSSLQLRYVA